MTTAQLAKLLAVDPALNATVTALAASWIDFCIIDVEHSDPVFVDVDVIEIVPGL